MQFFPPGRHILKGFSFQYLARFHLQSGEGNGNPLQYSCLENPRDGGAWWAAVYGVAQSWTWLSSSSGIFRRIFSCTSHSCWVILLSNRTARLTCRKASPLAPAVVKEGEMEQDSVELLGKEAFSTGANWGWERVKRWENSQEATAQPWGRVPVPPQGISESLGSFTEPKRPNNGRCSHSSSRRRPRLLSSRGASGAHLRLELSGVGWGAWGPSTGHSESGPAERQRARGEG